MSNNISIHGSHNAAIAFNIDDRFYVVETERFLGYKNAGLAQYKSLPRPDVTISQIIEFIQRRYGIDNFDKCATSYTHSVIIENGEHKYMKYEQNIPCNSYITNLTHHQLHAYSTFYQSPYDNNIIISFDGGGNDGFFNIYLWSKEMPEPLLLKQIPYDLGSSYMAFGHYLDPIKIESTLSEGNLVYSGKLMGLCGYGSINEEWIEYFEKYYKVNTDLSVAVEKRIEKLGVEIGVEFNVHKRIKDQLAYDIAATSQYVFEKIVIESIDDTVSNYDNSYAICLTGGCALNVLLNTSIKKKYNKRVFVTPNSSDCGIAIGGLFYACKPINKKPINLIYSGIPCLDIDNIGSYTYERSYNHNIYYNPTTNFIANILSSGKILGVIRNTSEHGPRALGNRSILCDPTYPDMKNILNHKVKHREWYRPFAPVVQYEKANKYFNILEDSPYMSFAFDVRNEFREKLSPITHIDGTARVQTLTKNTNAWLYDLLEEMEKINGFPILLNTSFNINGKPIVSTIQEAFYLLDNTKLDGILIQNTLILKR